MTDDRIEGVIKKGVGRLQDGAGGLVDDNALQAKGKLNEAAGFVQDLVGQAKDHVAEVIDVAKDRSSKTLGRAQSQVRDTLAKGDLRYADVEKLVVENPLAALGVAAVVGVIVGFLLRRPSR